MARRRKRSRPLEDSDAFNFRFCPLSNQSGPPGPCDGTCNLWVVHDHPERPLDAGAWICICQSCAIALRATARVEPRLVLTLKSGMDRRMIVMTDVLAVLEHEDWATRLLVEPDDYIREVWVADRPWWGIRYSLSLPPGSDLTWEEYDDLRDRIRIEAKYG